MALNQQKLISIIMEEAGKLPERCDGYRKEVIETLAARIWTPPVKGPVHFFEFS